MKHVITRLVCVTEGDISAAKHIDVVLNITKKHRGRISHQDIKHEYQKHFNISDDEAQESTSETGQVKLWKKVEFFVKYARSLGYIVGPRHRQHETRWIKLTEKGMAFDGDTDELAKQVLQLRRSKGILQFCPKCDMKFRENDRFCSECGQQNLALFKKAV
jgi:hypothetical protein